MKNLLTLALVSALSLAGTLNATYVGVDDDSSGCVTMPTYEYANQEYYSLDYFDEIDAYLSASVEAEICSGMGFVSVLAEASAFDFDSPYPTSTATAHVSMASGSSSGHSQSTDSDTASLLNSGGFSLYTAVLADQYYNGYTTQISWDANASVNYYY